jgi:hypothetical protein
MNFRNPYADQQESAPDLKPVQRPDLADLRTNAGKQPLQPRCWKCFAPLAQCKCAGGPQ